MWQVIAVMAGHMRPGPDPALSGSAWSGDAAPRYPKAAYGTGI
jgi:hypothetical protein